VKTESREPSDNKQQTGLKSLKTQAPSGGLFGIDQEVVTLRGLYGDSGILTDLRQADPILIHR